MSETIPTTFDPSILPAWAQRNADVVWLAKRNHDFRCEVCRIGEDGSDVLKRMAARHATQTREGTA